MERQEYFKNFNKISIFLTKFIFRENFDTLKKAGFVDSYVSDPEINKIIVPGENQRFLFLLFNNKKLKLDDIKNIINSLASIHVDIVFSYELINGYVMTVIDFPETYIRDYNLIVEGRYSKLSDDFKEAFPKTRDVYNDKNVKIGKENTLYFHIFNKTEYLRDFWLKKLNLIELDEGLEFWDKPDTKDIIFNYRNIT